MLTGDALSLLAAALNDRRRKSSSPIILSFVATWLRSAATCFFLWGVEKEGSLTGTQNLIRKRVSLSSSPFFLSHGHRTGRVPFFAPHTAVGMGACGCNPPPPFFCVLHGGCSAAQGVSPRRARTLFPSFCVCASPQVYVSHPSPPGSVRMLRAHRVKRRTGGFPLIHFIEG